MKCVWAMLCVGCLGWQVPAWAAVPPPPAFELVPSTVLAWDAELKQHQAKAGEEYAYFTFWVTNVCPTNVLIFDVASSCGCTVAQLPALPWVLQPDEFGPLKVTMDLRGRAGVLMRGVQLTTSAGVKALVVRAAIPQPPAATNQVARPGSTNAAPASPSGSKPVFPVVPCPDLENQSNQVLKALPLRPSDRKPPLSPWRDRKTRP